MEKNPYKAINNCFTFCISCLNSLCLTKDALSDVQCLRVDDRIFSTVRSKLEVMVDEGKSHLTQKFFLEIPVSFWPPQWDKLLREVTPHRFGAFPKSRYKPDRCFCSELNRKVNQMSCSSLLALKHSEPWCELSSYSHLDAHLESLLTREFGLHLDVAFN